MVVVAALMVLLLFILRPGASRLKSRIVASISSGVGRPVDIGSVHLRLLPLPGFDLKNLVVYDDPAFGAEPMLRASEVTASLRLLSLARGRLEIARLDLTEPSLNLVHGENGRWNLEALLERTAQIPLAPTGKTKSEPRAGFPYIEATSARINFKSGPEKKPYALTNADFSLWQDSENAWGVRLKAQPFRTDLNLNDTGSLQVSGTWQRASALRDTPLQFSLEWNRAQLGQLTKFFTGSDQGWRGAVQLDVTLAGTPAKLQIASNASIQDFRRYDIASGDPLRLAAHCDGQYSSVEHAFHEVLCNAPVGGGLISLKGDMGLAESRNYGLLLTAENVPASALVALAQRAKKSLPADLAADGTVGGSASIEQNAAAAKLRFEGRGEIADFRLVSAANKTEIGPETVRFVLTSGDSSGRASSKGLALRKSAPAMTFPDGPHAEFGPFPVAIGRTVAPAARGWINRKGYNISIAGDAEIAKTLRVARMVGLPALQAGVEGAAELDLQITGSWAGWSYGAQSGFPGPQVTGTAKLRDIRIAVRGTGGPIQISSADMQLASEEVRIGKLSAKAAGTLWTGSVEMPRGCGTPGTCQVHFNLDANQIAFSELNEWASPSPKERPWYRVLESRAQPGPPLLGNLRASGRVTTERLQVQNLAATHVSANVDLDGGKVDISEVNADFLGGKHHGEWEADFTGKPAACNGSGSVTGVSLARLADTMNDDWIAGTANANYALKGMCSAEFWASAEGTLRFDARDSTLPHIWLGEDAGPLKVTRLTGQARLHAGKFEMKDARLESPGGQFLLSGTASLKRDLDLKLAKPANGTPAAAYTIGGTLAQPRVIPSPNPETQARLKP
jgi:uncharacterized protein involved in outer membrane biogenesis